MWVRLRYGDVLADHEMHNRHSKAALGMSKTRKRGHHRSTGPGLTLAVRGTLAKSLGFGGYITRSLRICPCCNERVNKRVLNDAGRLRLKQLRKKYAKNND